MGLFLPGKQRVRNRRFDYEPRFYNPERDEKRRNKMRIQSKTRRGSPPKLVWLGLLLFIAIYLYSRLG